jgi:hypothetical protein
MGHVSGWALAWLGLGVQVAPLVAVDVLMQLEVTAPRPPPNWPTITSEVGTELPFKNERLFVRLIVRPCPVGTVITTGDHVAAVVVVANDAGFNAAQVAVEPPVTATPQL